MIITKTPFRMSFFGGGTDFPSFFNEYKGSVLSTTFDKYCYVTVRHLPRFFEFSSELVYSVIERVNNIEDINHPMIRNAMRWLDIREIRLLYEADLPARSGLGTSSSFAVGMLNAFHALKGQYIHQRALADEAIYLERYLCGEAGGWQDQIAVSYGGFNRIDFFENDYKVHPVIISAKRKKELEDNLMLFFTGFTRISAEIQKYTEQGLNRKQNQLMQMYSLVNEAESILTNSKKSMDEFGRLLNYTWSIKRKINSEISTDIIDEIYNKALKAGALGGKLLGAGGGGFLLLYVPKERQMKVHIALKELMHVPFKFDNGGSQVLYFSPETLND